MGTCIAATKKRVVCGSRSASQKLRPFEPVVGRAHLVLPYPFNDNFLILLVEPHGIALVVRYKIYQEDREAEAQRSEEDEEEFPGILWAVNDYTGLAPGGV